MTGSLVDAAALAEPEGLALPASMGVDHHVMPMTTLQFCNAMKIIGPHMAALFLGKAQGDGLSEDDLKEFLLETPEKIVALAAALSGLEVDVINNWTLDKTLTLIGVIFEVNKDFFLARVMPVLSERFGLKMAVQMEDDLPAAADGSEVTTALAS